ncbi:MAG: PBP1A family penicillin-binding protein [Deltaproteobacteria bacterium]|nr:PBP1A family penicillin-binding protein [Deltaproteobacteria bacterium]
MRRKRRVFRRALLAFFCLVLGAGAGLAAVVYYLSLDLPQIGPLLEGYAPPRTTRFLAADGTVIGEMFIERRTVVPVERIPKIMLDAVIAAEDASFRTHKGLDYLSMIRALVTNVSSGRLAQGASTITQQVARTFFLTREKTFSRKIREIILTRRIEERLGKDQILYLYLNQINFGHGRYGVEEASRFYFNKGIDKVTLPEAALLAGIPKGPAIYSPLTHPDAAKSRRTYVLLEMKRHKMITDAQAADADAAPIKLVARIGVDAFLAPEAVARAMAEIADVADPDSLRRGGYTVETTVDPVVQRAARQAAVDGLASIDAREGRLAPFAASRKWDVPALAEGFEPSPGRIALATVTGHDDTTFRVAVRLGRRFGSIDPRAAARYNPRGLPPSRFAAKGARLPVSLVRTASEGEPLALRLEIGPQAAVAVVEPGTFRIVALVGGDVVEPGGFDRASLALRQPGSAFKPFVYLTALRTRRYTAATIIDDSPEVQGEWQPHDADPAKHAGPIRLREALARSLNLPAVKVATDVTPAEVAALAARLGIASKLDPQPALALGSSGVTPLEMAGAYASLASHGRSARPWIVKRLVGPDGAEIPLLGHAAEQVITEDEAYVITSLLVSVVEEGTGEAAKRLGRPVAGKTGTTNDFKDAWFVGYTPDLAAAVWVGYDDLRPLGRREFGARAALPIWTGFMKQALAGRPARGFERPQGVVTARIDPATGLLAYEGEENAVDEVFIDGTQPTETAPPPDAVTPANLLVAETRDAGPP